MNHIEEAKAIITRANASIVLDEPFFGYLLLRREVVADMSVPTMATNGRTIYYNPKQVCEWTFSEVKGVILHEVMHIASLHHVRRQSRDAWKWNKAGDFVINAHIKKMGYTLPEGVLHNPAHIDHSTEYVYSILPDEDSDGDGDWNIGGVRDDPDQAGGRMTEAELQELEANALQEVIQAAQAARMRGKLPAFVENLVDDLKKSRVNYKQIMARFMTSISKADYSWMKPNKLYIEDGIYMPTLHSESCGPVVLVIDDSGSCHSELSQFLGELNGLLKQVSPEKVYVVGCDCRVHTTIEYTPDQLPIQQIELRGGGGTAFKPAFDWVQEKNLKPSCLIYLTDGYGDWDAFDAPPYPVLWGMTTDAKAPWGVQFKLM